MLTVAPSKLDLRFKQLRTLSESSIRSMVRSLEKRGQLTPVVVASDGPRLVLIDGFKRQRAAEILGLSSLMVITLPSEGALAKAHMYLLNRKNGFSMIEEAMLIRELVEVDGFMQVDVAAMLERHKSWVSRRLEIMRRLCPQIVEDLRLGLIPPGSALSLARLPQSNQADLCSTIQTHKLQTKECNLLIDLWCKAKDPEARKFLIKFPKKAMELACKDDGDRLDPRIPAQACRWLKTVRALERVAAALRLKSKHDIGTLDEQVHEILCGALDQTDSECQQALSAARQVLSSTACTPACALHADRCQHAQSEVSK